MPAPLPRPPLKIILNKTCLLVNCLAYKKNMPHVNIGGGKKAPSKGASRPTKSSRSKEATKIDTTMVNGMSAAKMAKYQAMYEQQEKEKTERASKLYEISRNIHKKTKYVKQTNGGEGQVRSKIHFLDALKKENYELALQICSELLEGDEGDDMLTQYKLALEGIMKADDECDSESGDSSQNEYSDDDESNDDSDSDSDSDSESNNNSGEDANGDRQLSSDEAEKKDDSILHNRDEEEDGVRLPSTLEEMFREAKMPAEERERLQELRAEFSSLRASVQDKHDKNEQIWTHSSAEAK